MVNGLEFLCFALNGKIVLSRARKAPSPRLEVLDFKLMKNFIRPLEIFCTAFKAFPLQEFMTISVQFHEFLLELGKSTVDKSRNFRHWSFE